MYQMGLYLDTYPVGAATTNTRRMAYVQTQTSPAPGSFTRRAEQTLLQPSNTGSGNHLTMQTTQRVEEGNFVIFKFFHANTGSDMRIAVNSVAWITLISDLNVTEVL